MINHEGVVWRLTDGTSSHRFSVHIIGEACVVLSTDTKNDIFELKSIWCRKSTLGHLANQLGDAFRAF